MSDSKKEKQGFWSSLSSGLGAKIGTMLGNVIGGVIFAGMSYLSCRAISRMT
jgi:hypothetical protein